MLLFFIFNGTSDIYNKMSMTPNFENLTKIDGLEAGFDWFFMMMISFIAVFLLPRQFQVSVLENNREKHLKQAIWMFPLYLLLFNVFVIFIAWAGKLTFGNEVNGEYFTLLLPLQHNNIFLALLGSTWQKGLAEESIPTVPVVEEDYEPKTICINSGDTQVTVYGEGFINYDGVYYTSVSWQGPTDTVPTEIEVDEINVEETMLKFTLTAEKLTEIGIGTFQIVNHPDFGDPREVGDPKTITISHCKIYLPLVMKNAKSFYPLLNGGFEAGPDGSWTESSSNSFDLIVDENYSGLPVLPQNGSWEAWLGGSYGEISLLSQKVTISPSLPYLHFWYRIISGNCVEDNDYFRLKINDIQTIQLNLCTGNYPGEWVEEAVNLSSFAGSTVSMKFEVTIDATSYSHFFLDDVSMSNVSTASPLDVGDIQILREITEARTISR